ncbi:MAG: hypothetical protein DRJ40_08895 [Thermoprotei archaeon]|nr:MAG: hypothetical protein DRJ40_08895 [Thermoprotei archaeon]
MAVRLVEKYPPVIVVEGKEIPVNIRVQSVRVEAEVTDRGIRYVAIANVAFEASIGPHKVSVKQDIRLDLGTGTFSDLEIFETVKKAVASAYPAIRTAAEILLKISAALGALGAQETSEKSSSSA